MLSVSVLVLVVNFITVAVYGLQNNEIQNELTSNITEFEEIYYCENLNIPFNVPHRIVKNEVERIRYRKKMCRYRDSGLYPADVFRWLTGHACINYFPPDWFSKRINLASCVRTIDGIRYVFPIGAVDNVAFFFDYRNRKYSRIIESTFKSNAFYQKWENCAKNADSCCLDVMNENNIYSSDAYPCPATWDAWSCFDAAQKNTISEEPCPDYTSSSSNSPCILYSQRECFLNGTWNQQTEYGTCASAPVYRRRHNFHIVAMYVSIALSFPAVIIFILYKKLRVLRVSLHRNLLIACILRNIFTIISKEIIILDSLKPNKESHKVMDENGVGCRMLAYFTSVFTNAIYACMLADGFYLHKLIVRVFSPDPNAYILYGATVVLSVLPTTIWAIVVAIEADEYCWMVDSSWYQWIPDGFRIAILGINVILLGDIMRALLMKLRKNVSGQHTKSTLRAMSFLIPLFGVPFILTSNRNIVDNDSCRAGDIYYYVSYSIQGLQGIMVAILFCYCNKEVHMEIKGTYRKLNLQYENRFGSKNNQNQAALRRETAATYVHNNSPGPRIHNFDNSSAMDPNKRVNDWLTENKETKERELQELEKPNGAVQFVENAHNRISRFIDDSSEDATKIDRTSGINESHGNQ